VIPDDDMDVPADVRRELMDAAIAKQLSYGWLCEIYRRGAKTAKIVGPTGDFPYGPLDADDEGGLAVAIAVDPRHGVVRFEFGKPVGWLALPAGHARQLAAVLLAKADELDRKRA
jgi:hypothetical protein